MIQKSPNTYTSKLPDHLQASSGANDRPGTGTMNQATPHGITSKSQQQQAQMTHANAKMMGK